MPALQPPLTHLRLQAPQWLVSFCVSIHSLPQRDLPAGQTTWQAPLMHCAPGPHSTPQPPQLCTSLAVVTQAPWQGTACP
jgi:hypothetical protein